MAWRLDSVAVRMLFVVAILALGAAACSGSNGTEGGGANTSAATPTVDDTIKVSASTQGDSEDAKTTSTTVLSGATDEPGEGAYSVLMLGKVDELTASNTMRSLEDEGIEGFVMEGSAEEGFNLYRSGLTYDEANDVLVEIFTAPGVYGGLIFETVNLP